MLYFIVKLGNADILSLSMFLDYCLAIEFCWWEAPKGFIHKVFAIKLFSR